MNQSESKKLWRLNNSEKVRASHKKYRERKKKEPDYNLNIAYYVSLWRAKYPEKVKAQRAIFVAKRNKSLKQLPCKMCGELKTEAHHKDYSKPLKIVWLCKNHHIEADRKRRKLTNK